MSVALLVVMGVAGVVGQNLIVTQVQARTADDMRGRVMSILRVTDAFEPLGFVIGGALAASLGNQSGLLVAAATGATMVALTAAVAGLTGERGSSGTRRAHDYVSGVAAKDSAFSV